MNAKFTLTLKITLITLFLAFISPGLSAASEPEASPPPLEFTFHLVEGSKKGLGEGFSFCFSRKGVPSVAFYDLDRQVLKFAWVQGGHWKIQEVAQSGFAPQGLSCSLAYDKADNPAIAFYSADQNLKLAVQDGSSWKIQEVDSTAGSGLYNHMLFNSGGDAQISYQSSRGTMLARRLLGAWLIQKVDESGYQTQVVNPGKGPVRVYYIVGNLEDAKGAPHLKMAENPGSGWNTSKIPLTSGCISFSVAIDSKGSPRIAYARSDSVGLFRETVAGSGVWKQEEIDSVGASRVSMVLQKNDSATVCFITNRETELQVARQQGTGWDVKKTVTAREGYKILDCSITADKRNRELVLLNNGDALNALVQKGGGWALGRVDGRIRSGGYVNLEMVSSGLPGLCYYDFGRKELHWASMTIKGTWKKSVIDSLGNVGMFASMKIDSTGQPGISYYDATRNDLKYAWRKAGRWHTDRVDYLKSTGLYTCLGIDRSNVPHVSYFNPSTGYLKYARKTGKGWHRERIARIGPYGGESVIFTGTGGPRVIFTDGQKLKKPRPNQSPVETYLKFATPAGKNKWKVTRLLGPQAVAIKGSGLSGDQGPGGRMVAAFIDRDQNLRVMRGDGKSWQNDVAANGCLGPTSARFFPDGTIGVMFVAGKSLSDSSLRFARYDGTRWTTRQVKTPLSKILYLALCPGPAGEIRFACGDGMNYYTSYFTQMK